MKITDVKTALVTWPISNDPWIGGVRPCRSNSFIEIYTNQELVGIRETSLGYFPDTHLTRYVVSPLMASYNGISGFLKVTALFAKKTMVDGYFLPPQKAGAGDYPNGKDESQIPVRRRKRGIHQRARQGFGKTLKYLILKGRHHL
jgi:hypothetical protein